MNRWWLLLFLAWVGCNESIVKEEKYPDGHLKSSTSLKKTGKGKYIKEGVSTLWYSNGNRESEFNYQNGQKEGSGKTWFKNGQIQFEGIYQEGYLIQESRWNPEGEKLINKEYTLISNYYAAQDEQGSPPLKEKYTVLKRNDNSLIKHGTFRSWFKNGKIKTIMEFREGEKEGISKEWWPNMNIKSQGHYLQGAKEGPWSYTYPTGKIQTQILYRHNLKDGPFNEWYPSGQKKESSEFTENVLEGKYLSWYPNGNPKEQSQYEKGVATGKALSWYEKGTLHLEKNFQQGFLQDSVIEWYPDGKVKSIQHYTLGNLEGLSKSWHSNGNLFIESYYKQGLLEGPYQWWTENGSLISKQTYKQGVLMHDTRVAKMKQILEATEVNIPIDFMGFWWGMKAEEVLANLKKLNGKVTRQLPEEITFSIPVQKRSSLTQMIGQVTFNNWGELWSLKFDFSNDEQLKFTQFAKFIEHELKFKLGLPKYTKDFKDLPGMLEKERNWGTLFVERSEAPYTKSQYPTIKAHLFGYENQKWITLELQNFLILEYAKEKEIKISGPFYEAVSSS